MFKIKFFVSTLIFVCFFLSCRKDTEIKPTQSPITSVTTTTFTPTVIVNNGEGSIVFNFKALVNGLPLIGNTVWYRNASGDSFTVSKFNYYISNIKFKKSDGTLFSEKESYHLNKHLGGQETFTISHVPAGTYTNVEFVIGVDSTRNVSGVQVGALDVKEDMFWDWNTGYIFFKLEGDYKTINVTEATDYAMHVGGFGGMFNNLEKCSFTLKNALVAKKDSTTSVFFYAKVDEVFKNPEVLTLEKYSSVTNKGAKIVSTNYKDMFEIYKIEN